MTRILWLMFLLHIVDDFVLQPICLSKLKQRDWWQKNAPNSFYKNDYKIALGIHALSWSIMIHLPLFLIGSEIALGVSILSNGVIHYITDDFKANKKKINLQIDQSIHLLQIFITWSLFILCYT